MNYFKATIKIIICVIFGLQMKYTMASDSNVIDIDLYVETYKHIDEGFDIIRSYGHDIPNLHDYLETNCTDGSDFADVIQTAEDIVVCGLKEKILQNLRDVDVKSHSYFRCAHDCAFHYAVVYLGQLLPLEQVWTGPNKISVDFPMDLSVQYMMKYKDTFMAMPLASLCKVNYLDFSMDSLQICIQAGLLYINMQDDYGNTCLHEAVLHNRPEMVKTLLLYHPDLHIENKYGKTPLLEAIERKFSGIARMLISAGTDINVDHGRDYWQMKMELKKIDEHLVLHALRSFIDTQDDEGNTILHYAAMMDQPEIVSFLFILNSSNFDISIENKAGRTAFQEALLRKHHKILRIFARNCERCEVIRPETSIQYEALRKIDCYFFLYVAIKSKNLKFLNLLISAGVDTYNEHWSALDMAAKTFSGDSQGVEFLESLSDAGAVLYNEDSLFLASLRMNFKEIGRNYSETYYYGLTRIKFFILMNAYRHMFIRQNDFVLCKAIMLNDVDMVRNFIDAGFKVHNDALLFNKTFLKLAIFHSCIEIIELLLSAGASFDGNSGVNGKRGLLEIAIRYNRLNFVERCMHDNLPEIDDIFEVRKGPGLVGVQSSLKPEMKGLLMYMRSSH